MQTFQVVECRPSAQACYMDMFTVLQRLHLCLSGSLLVKALQASVLAETLQPASDIVGDDDPPHMGSAATVSLYLQLILHLNVSNVASCSRFQGRCRDIPQSEDLHNYARMKFFFRNMIDIDPHLHSHTRTLNTHKGHEIPRLCSAVFSLDV